MTTLDYASRPDGSKMELVTRQTVALLIDGYRDLNDRKLFWITLILSGLVAGVFALVGIGPEGITLAGYLVFPGFGTDIISPADFYGMLFIEFGVKVWITWAATILALVSTAGIFPDLISGGSIDLYLSKPLGRLRLFLTKYVTGLMFVTLQIAIFCLACWIVIGIRGGVWDIDLFLAVPVVTVYYSFLFCVTVLVGMVTRSTLAAILVTLLFWFLLFLLNTGDWVLMNVRVQTEGVIAGLQANIIEDEQTLARWQANPDQRPGDVVVQTREGSLTLIRESLEQKKQQLETIDWSHDLIVAIKTPLPKTSESIEALTRWMVESARHASEEAPVIVRDPEADRRRFNDDGEDEAVQEVAEARLRNRSNLWVFGSSLAFEAVVLALAAWLFVRRDF